MLTEAECKSAICPPDKKQARFADSGGMYLQVSPAGSKRWFLKSEHSKPVKVQKRRAFNQAVMNAIFGS